ncbi:MAG: hypothetical protein AB8B61_04610 [Cyclobacteriaceae bacterium]
MQELVGKHTQDNSKDPCCEDCSKCIEIVNLILDCEANQEQVAFFENNIKGCNKCMTHHDCYQSIVTKLKEKQDKKCCPDAIMSAIKNAIDEKA